MTIIRQARDIENAAVRSLLRSAYAQYEAALPHHIYRAYLADLLDLDRHTEHGTLYVAVESDRIVASAAFYPDAGVQGVGFPAGWAGGRALAVDPRARSRGLAATMVQWCETLAVDSGAPVFAFHTAGFMSSAAALYARLGYLRLPEYDVDLGAYFGLTSVEPVPVMAFGRYLAQDEQAAS